MLASKMSCLQDDCRSCLLHPYAFCCCQTGAAERSFHYCVPKLDLTSECSAKLNSLLHSCRLSFKLLFFKCSASHLPGHLSPRALYKTDPQPSPLALPTCHRIVSPNLPFKLALKRSAFQTVTFSAPCGLFSPHRCVALVQVFQADGGVIRKRP